MKKRDLSPLVTRNLLIIIIEDALHIDDAQWLTIKKGGVVKILLFIKNIIKVMGTIALILLH